MVFAATGYDKWRKEPPTPSTLLLRQKAISLINEAISDGEKCSGDPAVSGVMAMAMAESFYGDAAMYDVHMRGLAKMVGLRGGLESLGLDGMLADMASWLDFNHAKLHGTSLYFDQSSALGARPLGITHVKATSTDPLPPDIQHVYGIRSRESQ